VAVPLPVVAVHEYTDGEPPRLVDVSRGAVDGTYHSELAPTENTSVRATFLGSAGPQGAEASASKLIPIRVSPKVTASFDSGGIRLGRSATLSGDVWPDHPNDEVKLQRKKRGTWRRVRTFELTSGSSYVLSIRPRRAGTFKYRVVKAPDGDHARGVSQTVTLVVRSR